MATLHLSTLAPPAALGIIGGGQLGSMLATVALQWGYRVIVLDPNPQAPAGRIASQHFCNAYMDFDAVDAFIAQCDRITYEFEHLPIDLINHLKAVKAPLVPSLETLEVIQDKYRQKQHLKAHGLPVAPDCEIHGLESLKDFLAIHQQCILKCKYGGYDGKGTFFIRKEDQVKDGLAFYGDVPVYAEAIVNFEKELSVMVVKSGDVVLTYQVAENVHDQGILIETTVPAVIDLAVQEKAMAIAHQAIATFNTDGLFCVELFLSNANELVINEIAPRAHNSGHYTIEACSVSQYESWLRILAGLPLIEPIQTFNAAMLNVLGPIGVTGAYRICGVDAFAQIPQAKLHMYGKTTSEPRRKIGHVTALGTTNSQALARAKAALQAITIESAQK